MSNSNVVGKKEDTLGDKIFVAIVILFFVTMVVVFILAGAGVYAMLVSIGIDPFLSTFFAVLTTGCLYFSFLR